MRPQPRLDVESRRAIMKPSIMLIFLLKSTVTYAILPPMSKTIISLTFTLALATWIGTVIFLNLIIIPLLSKFDVQERGKFIGLVFPRVFYMATIIAALVAVSGVMTLMVANDIGDANTTTRVGAGLIALLIAFHMLVVWRLLPMAKSVREHSDPATVHKLHRFLKIVPRFGLIILLTGTVLLLYG
jgi:uncharacterized membrane protein